MTGMFRLPFAEKMRGLALTLGLGALFMFGGAFAATAQDSGLLHVRVGDFNVELFEAPEGLQTIKVSCKNKDITQEKDYVFREVTADESALDFPAEGLETTKVNLYTGGANCCQGYYLLVVGEGGQNYAAYLEPYDGGLSRNDDPAGYAAIDPTFKGYEKEGTGIFLSRAESPRLSRLLVFADGKWRADKIGEFPDYYRSMLTETGVAADMHPLSRAIALGYYTLMKGDTPEAARIVLKDGMPAEFGAKEVVDAVFKDIQDAARDFDPVENISLN